MKVEEQNTRKIKKKSGNKKGRNQTGKPQKPMLPTMELSRVVDEGLVL